MVINAEDIDLRPFFLWAGGVILGVIALALAMAILASLLGRRRFGCGSTVVALVALVAGGVVVVVGMRIHSGDATAPDVFWALVAAPTAALCLAILLAPAARRDDSPSAQRDAELEPTDPRDRPR